jgi:2-keto-4-pentenoate hydratase
VALFHYQAVSYVNMFDVINLKADAPTFPKIAIKQLMEPELIFVTTDSGYSSTIEALESLFYKVKYY